MRDLDMQPQLQTVETTPNPATQRLIESYAAEIQFRRNQLLDDLAIYEGKLRDLDQLDPLDFTGLGKLYRSPITQIEALLTEFDGDD